MTGQKLVPVLELLDGTFYREETNAMIERLRSGELATTSAVPDR